MKSKYLKIVEVTEEVRNKKTRDFQVFNSKNENFLGWINWYPPFRKYAFTPCDGTVYDSTCLDNLSEL